MMSWCLNTKVLTMTRLTISLSDERHRALREAAVKRRKTIGQLIEESLEFYGIKTQRSAEELVAKARARAALGETDAVRLAVAETRAARRR
jgi:predicted transcriptional regulator